MQAVKFSLNGGGTAARAGNTIFELLRTSTTQSRRELSYEQMAIQNSVRQTKYLLILLWHKSYDLWPC